MRHCLQTYSQRNGWLQLLQQVCNVACITSDRQQLTCSRVVIGRCLFVVNTSDEYDLAYLDGLDGAQRLSTAASTSQLVRRTLSIRPSPDLGSRLSHDPVLVLKLELHD